MRKLWTAEQDAKLAELVAAGLSWEEIGPHFDLKRDAVRKHWREMNETTEDRAERLERRRLYMAEAKRKAGVISETDLPSRRMFVVPSDVLAAREARIAAPLTITGMICGDPPIGFSALDRKQAEVRI
jgi:hypothetical protein